MYIQIIRNYFDYLRKSFNKNDEFRVSEYKMKELLRHSLCVGLGLQSMSSDERVASESYRCSHYILRGISLEGWSEEYKQGVLESCIHCIELTMKRLRSERNEK